MKFISYLSIGSNMGDRKYYLDGAVEAMENNPKIDLLRVSDYYETEPFGVTDQAKFLNAVLEIETILTPEELLQYIQKVENDYQRIRKQRWGPRTLDIDILLYDELKVNKEDLIIPHPYLEKREFVLLPLSELNPEMILPSGREIKEVLLELQKSDN